ncbi:MAG: apolipoprotein N-acyltransferase [Acidobacteria bacterium]|nr:apolipoprotein N-acyltransferase [Acidobacteriota bacterium]
MLTARQAPHSAVRVFLLGVAAGMVFYSGTLYWVVQVMEGYGGLPTIVSVAIGGLLAAYLSLYAGLFALLLRAAVQRWGTAGLWWAPWFWVATEWARSTVGGGFPWVLLGTSQTPVLPVAQAASVVGVYGVSLMIAFVSTAAAAVAVSRERVHRRAAAAVAIGLVLAVAAGAARIRTETWTTVGRPLRVGLVQGSVAQERKYDPKFRDEIVQRYLDLSRATIAAGAALVIWPEASTPFYFDLSDVLSAPIRQLAVETKTPFLIGTDEFTPRSGDSPDRYFNSAVLLGPDGRSHGSYRKMQLVPFGEYVPLKQLLFFVGPLVEAVSDFSAGESAVVFDSAGRRLSVAICYESVYPGVARQFVAAGSELLATITNDAWFGRSSAAYQHFNQGAMRAIEQGRYVVRAANTGITGAVDPYGRVLARTDLFVPAAVTVDVRLIDARTIYSRFGDVVVWIALAVSVASIVAGRGRAAGGLSPRAALL